MTTRPRRGWLAWAAVALTACLSLSCLGLALAGAGRLELVHAAVFDVCQMRAYAVHWQDTERLPQRLSYDFTKSPESFLMLEVWVADGPALSVNRHLPQVC